MNRLNERAGAADILVAEEAAHRQPQHGWLTSDRQIRQAAAIAAVHSPGDMRAPAASRCPCPRMRRDPHPTVDPADVIDHHRRQLRKQNPARTAVSSHASKSSQSWSERRPPATTGHPATNVRERSSPDQMSIFAAIHHPPASRNLSQNQLIWRFTTLSRSTVC